MWNVWHKKLTRSIRDSKTSIDFVQSPPGSRRERVKKKGLLLTSCINRQMQLKHKLVRWTCLFLFFLSDSKETVKSIFFFLPLRIELNSVLSWDIAPNRFEVMYILVYLMFVAWMPLQSQAQGLDSPVSSNDWSSSFDSFRDDLMSTDTSSSLTTESGIVASEKPAVRDIHVVGLFPLSGEGAEASLGRGVLPAVRLALQHVEQSPDVLPGYNLTTTWNDTKVRFSELPIHSK